MTSFELPALPEPLLEFRDLFREGRYWESHEALEDAWREGRSAFYHGLILYASAFVHAARGNTHGIVAQLEKTLEALVDHPDAYLGVDVAGLREHARTCLGLVEDAGGGDRSGPSDTAWLQRLPTPTLDLDPDRVRGDEPELGSGGVRRSSRGSSS